MQWILSEYPLVVFLFSSFVFCYFFFCLIFLIIGIIIIVVSFIIIILFLFFSIFFFLIIIITGIIIVVTPCSILAFSPALHHDEYKLGFRPRASLRNLLQRASHKSTSLATLLLTTWNNSVKFLLVKTEGFRFWSLGLLASSMLLFPVRPLYSVVMREDVA